MMELRAVRYFLTVSETGSFSRAAELLHVAQPAISRQIQSLENELEMSLLIRSVRGTKMTPEGKKFYSRMRSLVDDFDLAREEMRSLRDSPSRKLCIGVPPTCAEEHGVPLLEMLSASMPEKRVEMVEGLSRFLPDWLLSAQVDLIIALQQTHSEQIQWRLIEREPLVLLAPVGSALLGMGPLPLHALNDVPLVLSTGFQQVVTNFARDFGVAINCKMQIDSVPAIRRIVVSRQLATVLPLSIARREAMNPQLAFRELMPAPLRTLHIGKLKSAISSTVNAVIDDYIRSRTALTS